MNKWFSNRGQMIQVTCAILGASIALMAWLAIPPQSIFSFAPVLFLIFLLWAVWAISSWHTRLQLQSTKSSHPTAAPAPAPAPRPTQPALSSLLAPTEPTITVANITCPVGGFWERRIQGQPIRIIVHSIQKALNIDKYRADVEIRGTGILVGGTKTEEISTDRYWMKRTPSIHPEPYSIYFCEIHTLAVRFVMLYVDHINPHANEVHLVLCAIAGKPEIENT